MVNGPAGSGVTVTLPKLTIAWWATSRIEPLVGSPPLPTALMYHSAGSGWPAGQNLKR